jgi:hypothetical protein
LGETACFRNGFELPIDVLRITLLSSANTAYDYHVMRRLDSVNHEVIAELVLPITG